MRIDVLTIFPEIFPPLLAAGVVGRAFAAGVAECHVHDLRAFSEDPHRRVDDRPFGGGPGMVMTCQPLADAVAMIEAQDPRPAIRVLLSPQGEPLSQSLVEHLAAQPRLLLIAGRYEGIDERVVEELSPREVSIGDFVVSGGELPAMLLIDAVVRLQPGALGHEHSAQEDSFSPAPQGGLRLLDCPHYTRPRVWRNREVPAVLLGGDHGEIARWRLDRRLERTRRRRPELLQRALPSRLDEACPSAPETPPRPHHA
jgi:tRNA (guanine37-N1)-methyltransferase